MKMQSNEVEGLKHGNVELRLNEIEGDRGYKNNMQFVCISLFTHKIWHFKTKVDKLKFNQYIKSQ